MSDTGIRQQQPRFDNTTGGGNRDAWNNRVPEGSGNGGDDKSTGGGGNDNKNKNPNEIDDDVIDSIWQKFVDPNDKNLNPDGTPKNQNPPPNNDQRPDPQKQMNDYLKSVGLDPIVLTDADKEKMTAGDFSFMPAFIDSVNQKMVNAHVKALSGAETMINAAVEKAVNKTKTEMQSSRAGEALRDMLHEALPFTKKPAISPVAQSVAQRFIERGMSPEDAVKGTKAYFDNLNNAMNNDGINKNRNANFSSNHRNQGSDGTPEGGWLAVLTGKGR